MARFKTKTISKRTVDALKVDKDTLFWDSELAGFGVRVHPTGRKVYVVQTRADGKAAKRVTVGRHGVITAEEARRRAALIISRIKAGQEPIPEPMAVKLAEGPTVRSRHLSDPCRPARATVSWGSLLWRSGGCCRRPNACSIQCKPTAKRPVTRIFRYPLRYTTVFDASPR